MIHVKLSFFFFFFNDTATTEIYTLSLHDALPIFIDVAHDCPAQHHPGAAAERLEGASENQHRQRPGKNAQRSEEHTSELQSQSNLVCRLLLEKKIHTSPPPHRELLTSTPLQIPAG